MSDDFYAHLPALQHVAATTDPAHYTPMPDDWLVVVTDVGGSTAAVEAGRYRDANYVGAASIAAVLNLAGERTVPFVFGGDGAGGGYTSAATDLKRRTRGLLVPA